MADRTAWTGAINFGGFPINVAAYSVTVSKAGDSFKSLCPCHKQPIKQKKVCEVTGDVIEHAELLKGVQVASGIAVVDKDAAEAIRAGESTKSVEIERFAPLDTVPINLGTGSMRVVADPKTPGAEGPANILWNGLRSTGRAAIIPGWVMKSGSRPRTLAVYADEKGLIATILPYATDLKAIPNASFAEDEKAQAMFEAFVQAQDYCMDDFDVLAYADTYKEEREKLVTAALNGEVVTVEDKPVPAASGPDLMAAMQAAMEAAKPAKKAPAKKRAKAKA